MSGNNKIVVFLMAGLLITACQTNSIIPAAYNFKAREVQNNPYGCWTVLQIKPEPALVYPQSISGELLFMDADTLFLLVSDHKIFSIFSDSLQKAELYTHQNMGNEYLKAASYFLIPNALGTILYVSEFGSGFLLLGLPVAVVGIITSIGEGSNKNNVLIYPEKNSLENLAQFARFPAGKPLGVDLTQMKLKPDPASFKKPKK